MEGDRVHQILSLSVFHPVHPQCQTGVQYPCVHLFRFVVVVMSGRTLFVHSDVPVVVVSAAVVVAAAAVAAVGGGVYVDDFVELIFDVSVVLLVVVVSVVSFVAVADVAEVVVVPQPTQGSHHQPPPHPAVVYH